MMSARRWIGFVLLEFYALALAWMQLLHGVKTDEAKYLLSIPYPHPPLARFILHLTDSWAFQEFFWRLIFASLCVQAVWLVGRLAHDLKPNVRFALGVLWLCNTAIVFQAGSIMMAPLTALEAWLFLYLFLRDEESLDNGGLVALLWLASLFTAYQAALFAPVVLVLLHRSRGNILWHAAYFCVPVALLCLYTLANPLAIASMLIHTDSGSVGFFGKVVEFLNVWLLLGGSVVLSLAGLYGILRNRLWPVFGSLVLVAAYVWLARFGYYAILFLPLSMAGILTVARKRQLPMMPLAAGAVTFSIVLFVRALPLPTTNVARDVLRIITAEHATGPILINGYFGHEWEYESRLPVLRYTPSLLLKAGTVVCNIPCEELDLSHWKKIGEHPNTYVKR